MTFMKQPVPLQASDSRQHYIPSPVFVFSRERHWLLDWGPSRDVLKAVLRKQSPHAGVPYFARGSEFDFELDMLIDELGMRQLEKPVTVVQHYRMTCRFLKLLAIVELHQILSAIPAKGI